MFLSASVGLIVGVVLGWYLGSARQSGATRLLDELYMRKVRLAESDREQAVKTLNQNLLQMATFDERFAALHAEIEKAVGERESARAAQSSAEEQAARRTSESDALRDALARATQFADEALHESSQAAKEREAAAASAEVACTQTEVLEREVSELTAQLRASGAANAALREDMESANRRLDRAAALHAEQMQQIEIAGGDLEQARQKIANLEPLEPVVEQLRAELALRDQRLAIAEAAVATLGARNLELEPHSERLRAATDQIATTREQAVRRESELEQVWRDRLDAERAARANDTNTMLARIAELAPLEPQVRDLDARVVQLSRDAEAAQAELTSTSRALASATDRVNQLERELSTERSNVQQLETRLAEQREAEVAARRDASTATAQAIQASKRAETLDQRLERERAKLEEAGQRENALSQNLGQLRSERADLAKQLAALATSHRTKQLEIDRRATRIDELRAAIKERDGRIRELSAERRALATEVKRDDARRARAPSNSVRDDLKRIAGIGPALERKLHDLGLRTFRQLAALSRSDVARIADQLGTTPERIQRDGWITAARGALRSNGA